MVALARQDAPSAQSGKTSGNWRDARGDRMVMTNMADQADKAEKADKMSKTAETANMAKMIMAETGWGRFAPRFFGSRAIVPTSLALGRESVGIFQEGPRLLERQITGNRWPVPRN